MDIPAASWHQAIAVRRSRRQYTGEPLAPEMEKKLRAFVDRWNGTVEGARIVFVARDPDKVFKGAIGSYGKIKGAPVYAAFIGNMAHPNVQENTGYLGEGFILEATAMGLSTCWVGGFFDPKAVAEQIELRPQERVLSVTPIGYAPKEYNFLEKMMAGISAGHQRKDVSQLCKEPLGPDNPAWVKAALEAARLAPSAVNRQPWRFSVDNDGITVWVDDLKDTYHIAKRLDCGIAMLHLEAGARQSDVKGSWEYLESPGVAKFVTA
ncbi:nitroreductase [Heliobacterium undosum]|uniref:Nitroreductase n=1 Tax=Heliomicrobium undosum TaxID=121734 RepID=A0A845L5W2_9FIRM|nr:nitroreductase family protein [Heliomicrobium undosum]MZP30060.1 nitroreductase [Heliomicrobium undosum]